MKKKKYLVLLFLGFSVNISMLRVYISLIGLILSVNRRR